jgi:hypothetical protein
MTPHKPLEIAVLGHENQFPGIDASQPRLELRKRQSGDPARILRILQMKNMGHLRVGQSISEIIFQKNISPRRCFDGPVTVQDALTLVR